MNHDLSEPFATLRRILQIRVKTDWSYTGSMVFKADGIRLEGNPGSSLHIDDGYGRGSLLVPGFVAEPHRGVNGTVTLTCNGREIEVPAFVYHESHTAKKGSEGESSFRVIANAILALPYDEHTSYTRETILGMHLGPCASTGMATHFKTNLFGRSAFIAGYPSTDPSAFVDAIQFVYGGPPLENDERHAVQNVLRFFSGLRGQSWFVETFDADLKPVGFYYENHGTRKVHDVMQPVNLHPITGSSEVAILALEFPTIVEKMRAMTEVSRLQISAMIHHYNDGSIQASPTSKIRDMSVALEALGLVLLGRPPMQTPIIESADFSNRIEPMTAAFADAFGDLDETDHQKFVWLKKKFASLNIASPREELFKALDDLGIGLSTKERSWIRKMRNVVLHNGYHGDESQETNLRINSEAAGLFVNVFARALLKRLGFSGRYLDAASYEDRYVLDTAPPYSLLPDTP